jgi:hypothetical protein
MIEAPGRTLTIITEINQFMPQEWTRSKAKEKGVAEAA